MSDEYTGPSPWDAVTVHNDGVHPIGIERREPAPVGQTPPADHAELIDRRARILNGSASGATGRITEVIPRAYSDETEPRVRVEWSVVKREDTCPLLSEVELLPDIAPPRPVYGPPGSVEPSNYDEDTNEPRDLGVQWDLSFGCCLSFGYRDDQLRVVVNTSDRDQANGITSRTTTPEQVAAFARSLLALVEPEGVGQPQPQPDRAVLHESIARALCAASKAADKTGYARTWENEHPDMRRYWFMYAGAALAVVAPLLGGVTQPDNTPASPGAFGVWEGRIGPIEGYICGPVAGGVGDAEAVLLATCPDADTAERIVDALSAADREGGEVSGG